MQKIYSVMINGRTLESRDLRELLVRAVCAKRKSDSKTVLRQRFDDRPAADNSPGFCAVAGFSSSCHMHLSMGHQATLLK
jgi:hypothetical protein